MGGGVGLVGREIGLWMFQKCVVGFSWAWVLEPWYVRDSRRWDGKTIL